MDEKAYAVFLVGVYGDTQNAAFGLIECSPDFDNDLAVYLEENPPRASDGVAIGRFFISESAEGAYDLEPIEGLEASPYTKAYFWRDDAGGIVTIKGRYW